MTATLDLDHGPAVANFDPPRIITDRQAVVSIDAMGVKLVSDKKVRFTAAVASDYADLQIFRGEREVTSGHCQFLYDEMARGRFNWDNIVLASCTLDGVRYKINGQHTCWARLALEGEGPDVQVRELRYVATTIGQLKALYSSFDRGKPRSDSHLVKVELADAECTEGFRSETISLMSAGYKLWRYVDRTSDYNRIIPAEIAVVIQQDHGVLFRQVGLFYDSLAKASRPRVRRQPVVAAMLETFDRKPVPSPGFWRDVAEGTNLVVNDARWHLNNYLSTTNLQRTGGHKDSNSTSPEEMYRHCIGAWNRWRSGQKVQKLLTPKARIHAK